MVQQRNIPGEVWIVLAGLVTWSWVLSFDFVWDDYPMIVHNPSLLTWSTLWNGWFHDFWMLHDDPEVSGYWRPVPTMLHVFLVKIFGKVAWAFHLTSMLLHIGIAVFLYRFLKQVFLVRWAWAPTLFFLCHPLHSEAVGFNSAVPDLLSAFFGCLAVLLWIQKDMSSSRRFFLTILFLSLSFLSKESGVFFGPFLVLVDLLVFRRERAQESNRMYVGIVVISLLYVVGHLWVTEGLGTRSIWGETIGLHVATVVKLFAYQLFLLVVPVYSSPTRDFAVVQSYADPVFLLGVFLAVLFFAGLLISIRKKSNWAFVFLFYALFWFPVSNLIPAEA